MYFDERVKPTTVVRYLAERIPVVQIENEALVKMQLFVSECSDEIGWLGTATREGRIITIDDVFLFDQEVHATTTEITPDGLSEFAMELLQKPEGIEIWNNMKVWGHSHVNMGVSPSGQDDAQMRTFAEGGHDWFIRIIANKKGELKVDLYDYVTGIIYLDISWVKATSDEEEEIHTKIQELQDKLDELEGRLVASQKDVITNEMKVKVRKKVYVQPKTHGQTTKIGEHGTKITTIHGNTVKPSTSNWHSRQNSFYDLYDEEDYDYFVQDDEVVSELPPYVLQQIGRCRTLRDVEEEMSIQGYDGMFTDKDLERIYRVARKKY